MTLLKLISLPTEILELILNQLYVDDKIKLEHVNKEWNAFMRHNRRIWRVLRFDKDPFGHKVHDKPGRLALIINTCTARARGEVICLDIRNFSLDEETQDTVLKLGPNLMRLEVGSIVMTRTSEYFFHQLAQALSKLKSLTVHKYIPLKWAVTLLNTCLSLEQASFQIEDDFELDPPDCTGQISPRLRNLRFSYVGMDTIMIFPQNLLFEAYALEVLQISGAHKKIANDFRQLKSLQRLSVRGCENLNHLNVPSSIKHLRLSSLNPIWLLIVSEISYMPELETLIIDSPALTDQRGTISKLFTQVGSKLTQLWLRSVGFDVSPDVMYCLLTGPFPSGQLADLKELALHLTYAITDDALEVISFGSPNLEKVSIVEMQIDLITPKGLQKFVEALPLLSSIEFGADLPWDDPTTLNWMRNRGINVDFDIF